MLGRITKRTEAAAAIDEYVIPRSQVVAAHHEELSGVGRVHIDVLFSQQRPGHLVVVLSVGRRSAEPVVRVQSSCLYGETFGSLGCDCHDQLHESLARMRAAGSGILVYLDQEGRGAGLTVKALAYELAERLDFDTFDAYSQLGFEHDLRAYGDAVRVLKLLEVGSCVLLTNNPAKVRALEDADITVRRQALWAQKGTLGQRARATRRAHGYLD